MKKLNKMTQIMLHKAKINNNKLLLKRNKIIKNKLNSLKKIKIQVTRSNHRKI